MTLGDSATARRRDTRLGHRWRQFTVSAAFIGLSACGGSDWAAVDSVRALSPEATQLVLELDYCDAEQNPAPVDSVVESPTEIRVRLDIPIPSDDRDACKGFADVQLSSPIGQRTVVDDRTGERHTVEFDPTGAPPTTTTLEPASRPQYAVLTADDWTLQEAIDPPADSPLTAAERPPLTWWAEYIDGPAATVRLSGHAASFADTIAALEAVGFSFDELSLHRWPAVGGSAPDDPASPTILILDTGGDSLMLLSYERDRQQLAALADTVELVDHSTWTALGGVIQ